MSDYLRELLGVRDRVIMDPVHGAISLHQYEIAILDHPLFQRLRYICQNDILSLVFPGATHSRFLHSLGTLHIGGRMVHALIAQLLNSARSRYRIEASAPMLAAVDRFARLVRLACLLHDSGHCSFSHQFARAPGVRALLAEPSVFEGLWAGVNWHDLFDTPPSVLEHEFYSLRVAWQILEDTDTGLDADTRLDVLGLMEKSRIPPSKRFAHDVELLWPLLAGDRPMPGSGPDEWQAMLASLISGEVDADRADYLLRDAFHSSVTLGNYNLDHLLQNLEIGYSEADHWLGLSIRSKGLGALEDFVYSRFQMYRRIYGHKTAAGFDWLLQRAIDEVLQDDSMHTKVRRSLSDVRQLEFLTDNFFWEAFRDLAQRKPGGAAAALVYRRRLRHLDSASNLDATAIEARRQQLCGTDASLPVIACMIKVGFSRIDSSYSAIRVREGNLWRNITECSDFFVKFHDETLVHFYMQTHEAA